MSADKAAIRRYFEKFGLENEIADIYLALHAQGEQTISELSRTSKVERTRIYRLIDKLQASNLIEVESRYKRSILKAAPLKNLQILIAKKEQELKALHEELQLIEDVLGQKKSLSSRATRVNFYQGPAGVKQMFWNQAQQVAESNISILREPMQILTGEEFFARWVAACNRTPVQSRSIVGEHFLKSLRHWWDTHDTERLRTWNGRFVPEDVFIIEDSTVVFNDTIQHFSWREGEVFGVEIINPEMANSKRQLFDLLWEKANPDVPILFDKNYSSSDTSRQKAT